MSDYRHPISAFPCKFQVWNQKKERYELILPAVNCGRNCDSCGWNPDVAEKRLEKMGYKK